MMGLPDPLKTLDLRWPAIGLSCLFSLLVIILNPIPNDDAFSYLRAAQLFGTEGLRATLSTYGWYGYSVLIGLASQVLPGSLMTSAHILNILAFALLVYAFVTLAMEFRATRHVQVFAVMIILCFPTINEMRFNLIRDFAYWGFCLTALVQLIRYNRSGALVHALGWVLAMAAAIFFRLEGLIILALSPFALLAQSSIPLAQRWLKTGSLFLLVMVFTAAMLLVFLPADVNLVDIFRYAWRWYLPLLTNYPDTLANAAAGVPLALDVTTDLALFTGKGLFILFLGFLWSVISNLVMALGPALALVMGYAFLSGKHPLPAACKWPWAAYLVCAVLALLVFVSILQFLTTRYAVLAALLLLSVMPLYLEQLYQQAMAQGSPRRFQVIVTVIAAYFLLDSLVSFGYSKRYIEDAIDWSQANIAAGQHVTTNNFALAYYTGLVPEYDMIESNPSRVLQTLPEEGYVILELAHDNAVARKAAADNEALVELVRFGNKRDDIVVIYQLQR